MGAFHIACTFLAVLGRRFGDAGLRDMVIETEIVAAGSVGAVLEGRHYNRGLRANKLLKQCCDSAGHPLYRPFQIRTSSGFSVTHYVMVIQFSEMVQPLKSSEVSWILTLSMPFQLNTSCFVGLLQSQWQSFGTHIFRWYLFCFASYGQQEKAIGTSILNVSVT